MPDRDVIDRFLSAPHVAIVGVHRDTRQFANSVHRQLRRGPRDVHPVHPDVAELDGDRCVPSVDDLPPDVRDVLVMVDPRTTDAVVDACLRRGVDRIWLHRGMGSGSVTPAAVAACRSAGVEVVDGACPMMFAEPVGWFHRVHRRLQRDRAE